jgi:hypothetical protein
MVTKKQWNYTGKISRQAKNTFLQDEINSQFLRLLSTHSQRLCSEKVAYDVKNVFGFRYTELSYCYDETNKELSHLSGVPVKKYLPSARIA